MWDYFKYFSFAIHLTFCFAVGTFLLGGHYCKTCWTWGNYPGQPVNKLPIVWKWFSY